MLCTDEVRGTIPCSQAEAVFWTPCRTKRPFGPGSLLVEAFCELCGLLVQTGYYELNPFKDTSHEVRPTCLLVSCLGGLGLLFREKESSYQHSNRKLRREQHVTALVSQLLDPLTSAYEATLR